MTGTAGLAELGRALLIRPGVDGPDPIPVTEWAIYPGPVALNGGAAEPGPIVLEHLTCRDRIPIYRETRYHRLLSDVLGMIRDHRCPDAEPKVWEGDQT